MQSAEPLVLLRLRGFLLALLALGLAGTAAELLLIGHYEDPPQWAPLAAIGVSFAGLLDLTVSQGGRLLPFRATMIALVAAGASGIALHHRGTREFQLELDPSLRGTALMMKALQAKTPPALAPANLVFFGLLGLASTYKQPVAAARPAAASPSREGA